MRAAGKLVRRYVGARNRAAVDAQIDAVQAGHVGKEVVVGPGLDGDFLASEQRKPLEAAEPAVEEIPARVAVEVAG